MKRRLLSLLLVLLLFALWPAAALAEGEAEQSFPYVLDNAGLLSDSQRSTLEEKAAALTEQHGCALYIITVPDHTQFNQDIRTVVKGIQESYGLGSDCGGNVVILLLSTQSREYWAEGFGTKGEAIYSYESSWIIEDQFLDNLGKNDWYGGFSDFLDACDTQLTKLEKGEDVNAGADIITGPDGQEYHSFNAPGASRGIPTPIKLAIVVFVPLLIALIVCSSFKAQMKTAREKTEAEDYIVPRSMELSIKDDIFTHRTESRSRIESDSGSRGGGGGSSFSSGGGSSGRGGKF